MRRYLHSPGSRSHRLGSGRELQFHENKCSALLWALRSSVARLSSNASSVSVIGRSFRHGNGYSFTRAAFREPEHLARGFDSGWRVQPFLITLTLALSPLTVMADIFPLPFSATMSLPFAARMPSGPLTGWSIQISTGAPGLPAASTGMR